MFQFVITLLSLASAQIIRDYNCTTYDDSTRGFSWSLQAVSCQNVMPDPFCADIFLSAPGTVRPEEGKNTPRPPSCYSYDNNLVNDYLRQYAIDNCPRTCGFCCLTNAYNCKNTYPPRLNCATVTKAMCEYEPWTAVLIEDCPATCGYCEVKKQCVDLIPECKNDIEICSTPTLQGFVNVNCRRTCGRCLVTTPAPTTPYQVTDSSCENRYLACNPKWCYDPEFQDFVNVMCQRTCSRCGYTTSSSKPSTTKNFNNRELQFS